MDHLSQAEKNALVDRALDRMVFRRQDQAWIMEQLQKPATRVVPVWKQKSLVNSRTSRARFLSPQDLSDLGLGSDNLILLGQLNGKIYFAYALDTDSDQPECGTFPSEFEDLRKVGPLLDDREATLLAYAKSLCHWHDRHRYCGVCGSPTASGRAGHVRICQNTQCGASHFPRIDPAIIVLVHCQDRCLLGRQSRWPKKRYSTIAGFVEPGESAEHAVLREVWEETGIRLDHLNYQSSQPWPFPGSLMLGFHAEAAMQDIHRNDEELEDARWFSRREIMRAIEGDGDIRLPPRISISRRLIEDWCHK